VLLRTSERREVTWVVIEAANRWIVRGSGYTDLDRTGIAGQRDGNIRILITLDI
jgi:hypothetical protein